jgi:hypothetical protein
MMTDETIVAVYDTAEHAALAVRDLEAAGIPSSAISQHAAGGVMTASTATTTAAPHREQGFWASLFGGEPEYEHDTTVYNRSLESGSMKLPRFRGVFNGFDDYGSVVTTSMIAS